MYNQVERTRRALFFFDVVDHRLVLQVESRCEKDDSTGRSELKSRLDYMKSRVKQVVCRGVFQGLGAAGLEVDDDIHFITREDQKIEAAAAAAAEEPAAVPEEAGGGGWAMRLWNGATTGPIGRFLVPALKGATAVMTTESVSGWVKGAAALGALL